MMDNPNNEPLLYFSKEEEDVLVAGATAEMQAVIRKYQSRVRQLRKEIEARREENALIINENLQQNEELRSINVVLDKKIQDRTCDLESSKQQLEAQNQALQEVNETKEAMMHMIVHDMKNPLTSVMGALILVQKVKSDLPQDIKDLLKDAHVQAIKLRTMMDDILTISKMKSNEFQVELVDVDLISLVQQSVLLMNTVKGEKDVTIEFQSELRELIVSMDFQMIERVINNIINNAIKYAPAGTAIKLQVVREGSHALVTISDRGEGIPSSHHEKIFEMFTRVKPQDKKISGTGLGLAFCKLAIEAHSGRIWVSSPLPGETRGTMFHFTLPLSNVTVASASN
jgi:two-component system sensor histidine kinase KdpD